MRRKRLIETTMLAMGFSLALSSIALAAPVAHWKLDDGQVDNTTLTAVDSIAPSVDGTWTAGTTDGGIPRWVTGLAGGAADFGRNGTGGASAGPGTGDVITTPGDGKLNITGELTISAWILYDEANGQNSTRHIAGKDRNGGATEDAYSLKHSMSGGADLVQFMVDGGSANTALTATNTLTNYTAASSGNNGWVHVVGVYKPSEFMRIYINGALDNSLTTDVPAAIDSEPTTPFNIGRLHNSDSHSFNGSIDDVQVYNSVLSDQQVAFLFQNPGQVVSSTVPGDFDGDGDVDGEDFVVWQSNFPMTSSATVLNGDADGDGDVDGADFVVWQTNFPTSPPVASSIPEPKSVVIFATGCAICFAGQLRRSGLPSTLRR